MNEISESVSQGKRTAEDEEDKGMAAESDFSIRGIEETI
jgi:hypothetical protein